MKVNQSSVWCADYNKNNEAAISVGVLELQEPDDRTLASEAKEKQEEAKRAVVAEACSAILNAIGKHEGFNKVGYAGEVSANFDGVCVTVQRHFVSHGSRWSSSFDCWRVDIDGGGYGKDKNCKWVKIGGDKDLPTMDAAQLARVTDKLATVKSVKEAKVDEHTQEARAAQRKADFTADPANALIVKWFSLDSYYSYYQPACARNGYMTRGVNWSVKPNGAVCIRYTEHTRDQWQALAELKQKHSAEYAALEATFKTA